MLTLLWRINSGQVSATKFRTEGKERLVIALHTFMLETSDIT